MNIFKYELRITVESTISGVCGIVISRRDSLTGCNAYLVQPKGDKHWIQPDPVWINEYEVAEVFPPVGKPI